MNLMNISRVKEQEESRLRRVICIINELADRGVVSTSALAREYELSARTIQRDLKMMLSAGIPVRQVGKGQYSFGDGFSLRKCPVTSDEESLLRFLSDVCSSLGRPFEGTFQSIVNKFYVKDIDTSFFARLPVRRSRAEYSFIKELDRAIDEFYKVKIVYRKKDQNTERMIMPLKIIYDSGFWYLFAMQESDKGYRTFCLDNIVSVSVTDKIFRVKSELKKILSQSVNVWFSDKKTKKVELMVDKEVADYFENKVYFPMQRIRLKHGDGSLIIEARVSEFMEIIPTIFQWIPHIKVISPGELKDRVLAAVREYADAP